MDAKLHKKLSDRQEKGTLRSLSSFEGFVDFFSNDYLGLARDMTDPVSISGSTGSRLLSGNSSVHEEIEEQFARLYGAESALHFNSGYDANLGIFSSIPQKGDTILYDELIHASARDGMRLSWAKSFSFRHNDLDHLEQRLKKAEGTIYVAVESLYSMDGDIAPLRSLASLCSRYNAFLIIDEAHTSGIHEEVEPDNAAFIRLITFGKAYGSHGALVLCSPEVREYLINFSRPFIYSTALPASVLKHNYAAASHEELKQRRIQLNLNSSYFKKQLTLIGLTTISADLSPIQIIELGDISKVKAIAEKLQSEKIAVKPIYSPTVPEGKERLRICLHAYNTHEEIDQLLSVVKSML